MIYRDFNGELQIIKDIETIESLSAGAQKVYNNDGWLNYTGDASIVPDGEYFKFNGDEIVIDIIAETQRLDSEARELWKEERTKRVTEIKVTTAAGNEFDGDEISQTRMSRAISVMSSTDTTTWILANNNPISATKAELKEALKLAGEEQTFIWIQ